MDSPLNYLNWFYAMPAQLSFDETAAPRPAPAQRPMSFSDLRQGMRAVQAGETKESGIRGGILGILACVAFIALVVHLWQRHKSAGPPDSLAKLGWELSRRIRFPLGSRLVLIWVGRATKTPFASLLLSAAIFDRAVEEWAKVPTFSAGRQWARGRLLRLRPVLFG